MQNSIYKYINNLKEDDFSRDVVLELFKELGYERCSFNGGAWEFGKDLVFTIKAGLEENRIHIQSKKLVNCKKGDVYKITHQLNQCLKDGTFDGKGRRVRANKVYLAFPEQQHERLLSEIVTAVGENDRFEILDGVKLVSLIEEKAPKLKEKLCTTDEKYTKNFYLERTNEELLKSINADKVIDIEKLYSDLSFYIGSVDSKHFLQSLPTVMEQKVEIDFSTWEEYRALIETCENDWKLSLVIENLEEIECKIDAQKLYYTRQKADQDQDIKKSVVETANLENESKALLTPNSNEIDRFLRKFSDDFKTGCATLKSSSNPSTVLNFLKDTRHALEFYHFVETNKSKFNNFLHFNSDINSNAKNLTLSPFLVFDSKLDIALYGEAGAGKTTTLSQYAKYKIQKDPNSVIYLKLNKVYTKYIENKASFSPKAKENLIFSLVCINSDEKVNSSTISDVKGVFRKERTLILDGLDEVYKAFPNLLEDIESFKDKYPHIQMIISSRDCVSYLSQIRFLGITLEPFTGNQINEFAKLYLGEEKYTTIKDNLNSGSLLSVLRTPLLATVACELFKQGIQSFENENEIYDCRLRLLTGEYDLKKGISRFKNHHQHLKKVMITLAFYMHTNNRRFVDYEQAIKNLEYKISMNRKKIESLFEELITDANLLFINKSNRTISFGHFRFQEHLASIAIRSKPNFDWIAAINNDFWQGALELYAMENSIEFLFEVFGGKPLSSEQKRVLKFIIAKSPIRENRGLIDFINFKYT